PSYPRQTIRLCSSSSTLGPFLDEVIKDAIPLGPSSRALAFDMEWPIQRRRGHESRTSLIQIAGQTLTLLIQFSKFSSIPPRLYDFLVDCSIVKLGVGIRNDGLKLLRDFPDQKAFLNSFLELSFLAKAIDPQAGQGARLLSLQEIVARYLDVYLPKGDVRTSDW
ncbi:hypothetical protein CROQUDRAFT_34585, partial [Cronartium quercuum f. sp. fusiforme G11]